MKTKRLKLSMEIVDDDGETLERSIDWEVQEGGALDVRLDMSRPVKPEFNILGDTVGFTPDKTTTLTLVAKMTRP